MTMPRLEWYVSNDNASWVAMPSPSTYKIEWSDLDDQSYRSVATGDMIEDIIKRRWAKLFLSFKALCDFDTNFILSRVNADNVYFKILSPAFGDGYISFKGRVSKMSTELLLGTLCKDDPRYNVSFNVVQIKGAEWQ